MSTKTGSKKQEGSLFELDGVPSFKRALPMAVQHVLAMVVGCVTPAIIIAGEAIKSGEITANEQIVLVQAALLAAALSTFIQLFPVHKRLGSRLPVIMGVSFAYVMAMQVIVRQYSLSAVFGAQLVGGAIAVLVGIFIKQLRVLFPPLVTGTVVFTIGLSLYHIGIEYMAGGKGSAAFGDWRNWLIALITLAVVITLNHFGKGIFKLGSILIGIIVGYAVAACFGIVNLAPIADAGWFYFPKVLKFGVKFEPAAIFTIVILHIVSAIQAIGEFSATAEGGLDREATAEELSGGVVGNGIANMISALFGGLPTATFGQNVGIVCTTKVVNRCVMGISVVIIFIAALVPKIASILTTIPHCVLGGATVSVFATITMTGIKLITKSEMNYRNTSIVGLSVALGCGISQVPEALSLFPSWVGITFGGSPVVVATLVAVLLNLLLPGRKK